MSTTINCSNCGASSPAVDPVIVRKCSQCGSDAVNVCQSLEINETFTARDSIGGMVKDPSRPSDQKVRQRFKGGDDFWCKASRWVHRVLSIDRDRNRYFERVTDPETGEVIHECDEPLTEHLGHGSDKKRS